MKLNPMQAMFLQLLEEMPVAELYRFSTINHHANGMDYLCLQRDDRVTLKIYLIRGMPKENGGFLINPHSHRYSFMSSVLCGSLRHYLFKEAPDAKKRDREWVKHVYRADEPVGRRMQEVGEIGLEVKSALVHQAHPGMDTYFVDPSEIHTLEMIQDRVPTMIGLIQHSDVSDTSELYTKIDGKMILPDSRKPTYKEAQALRDECIHILRNVA
jgi:hypothetical protein